ncbi:zinc-binding dehydrogenase [Nocardioides sp. LMS-CY]|uniref:zinc-binding dehydrogenase n=1 Tax=Nocardioides sp. (strain LMS-CY) TaxID=2840457 RepID=UPI001C004A1A|nr:zinc-binding dehydrogenase [Nocardioides sp. LMS-CY]QWF22731.1 zinc-binding dehydrogenase [Nocardioides sp. LMS-CY]
MWAYRVVAPGRLAEEVADEPTEASVGEGEVVLRMLAGGICGSDLPKFAGTKDLGAGEYGENLPGRLGAPLHEVVGVVEITRHPELRVGDRVVGWASRSDGLAERVISDGDRLRPYRPSLAPGDAVVIQSLACVIEALGRVPIAGRDVAIIGLGPIGLLFAHVARARGARHVVGVDLVDRADAQVPFGLDECVHADSGAWAESAADRPPDLVVEAVGHQTATVDHALRAVAVGGTVLCFGIPDQDVYPVDVERLMRKSLTLIGGVTRFHARALTSADDYLHEHAALPSALVTHRFGRADLQRAYETAARPASGRLKVVLDLS